jgi:hypothetical protein
VFVVSRQLLIVGRVLAGITAKRKIVAAFALRFVHHAIGVGEHRYRRGIAAAAHIAVPRCASHGPTLNSRPIARQLASLRDLASCDRRRDAGREQHELVAGEAAHELVSAWPFSGARPLA